MKQKHNYWVNTAKYSRKKTAQDYIKGSKVDKNKLVKTAAGVCECGCSDY